MGGIVSFTIRLHQSFHTAQIFVCNSSRLSTNTMHISHYVVAIYLESELMCAWFLPQHCS